MLRMMEYPCGARGASAIYIQGVGKAGNLVLYEKIVVVRDCLVTD